MGGGARVVESLTYYEQIWLGWHMFQQQAHNGMLTTCVVNEAP